MTAPRRPAVRRSTLILPVHVARFVERAAERDADVIMLDLEDSVAPSAKAEARAAVRAAIPVVARRGATVTLRVNHDAWREDLEAALWPGISGVTFPKAESADELRAVAATLDRLERERGIPPGSVAISPAIETLIGLANAAALAVASPRITGIGGPAAVDFAADLGVELDPALDQLEAARGTLDLLARSLGGRGGGRWRPGDVITEYGEDGAARRRATAAAAQRDGSRGSAGIHPSVVAAFNAGYTPDGATVAAARALLDRLTRARAAGRGWAELEGRRVSVRSIDAVRDEIAFAEACAAVDRERDAASGGPA